MNDKEPLLQQAARLFRRKCRRSLLRNDARMVECHAEVSMRAACQLLYGGLDHLGYVEIAAMAIEQAHPQSRHPSRLFRTIEDIAIDAQRIGGQLRHDAYFEVSADFYR